jgi:hypothetical protein
LLLSSPGQGPPCCEVIEPLQASSSYLLLSEDGQASTLILLLLLLLLRAAAAAAVDMAVSAKGICACHLLNPPFPRMLQG